MRRNLATLTSVLALVFAVSCKKEEKGGEKPADGSGKTDPGAGKTTGDGDAPKKDESALRLNDQKNCPSAVITAETKVEKTDTTIIVKVRTPKLSQVKEIRTRGQHLAKVSAASSDKVEHTGGGTGGGLGKCPVVLHKTKVTAEDQPKGTKVTITPDDPADLDKLFAMAQERAEDMNERGGVAHGSGAGMGKGEGSGGGKGGKKKDGANPCGGAAANPCGGAAANPCGGAAKPAPKNPCGGAKKAANPCAGKKAPAKKADKPAKKADKPANKKDEGGW